MVVGQRTNIKQQEAVLKRCAALGRCRSYNSSERATRKHHSLVDCLGAVVGITLIVAGLGDALAAGLLCCATETRECRQHGSGEGQNTAGMCGGMLRGTAGHSTAQHGSSKMVTASHLDPLQVA